MPDFLLTAPDGKQYKVSGPDAAGAVAALKKMLAGGGGVASVAGQGAAVQPSTIDDVAKSAASGLVTGTEGLAGIGGDVTMAGIGLADLAKRKMFGGDPLSPEAAASIRRSIPMIGALPSSAKVGKTVNDLTGFTPYDPRTGAGDFAKAAAELVPGAVAFGLPGGVGSAVRSGLKWGVGAGLTSEAAGKVAESAPATAPYADWFRFGGAFVGPGMMSAGRRLVTPFPALPGRTAAAKKLADEGVTLTAGQKTGSRALQFAESELGGGAAMNAMDKQGRQFTAAVLRRAGIKSMSATPDVIGKAFKDVGNEFDRLAAAYTIPGGTLTPFRLNGILRSYLDDTNELLRLPIVERTLNSLIETAKSGRPITGEEYKTLRSYLGKRATAFWSKDPRDPLAAQAFRGVQDALDEAMEKAIGAVNPTDLGAFADVRGRYRSLLVIEDAAGAAGASAASGIITPAQLRASVTRLYKKSSYARSKDDFSPLARAGVEAMTPMPDSGTASRNAVRYIPGLLGAGAAAGSTGGDLMSVLSAGTAGLAAPMAVGRAMLSRPGRAYLGNQLMQPQPLTQSQRAAIAMLYSRPMIAEQFPPMLPYTAQNQR